MSDERPEQELPNVSETQKERPNLYRVEFISNNRPRPTIEVPTGISFDALMENDPLYRRCHLYRRR